MTAGVALIVALAIGYALGSLPLSTRIGRAFGVDVSLAGDRNPGAANVWWLAGRRAGALALAADLAKGALAVAIGWLLGSITGSTPNSSNASPFLGPDPTSAAFGAAWAGGVGAFLGHAYPAFGRRRGGRGVATVAGACGVLVPPAAAVAVAVTLVTLALVGRVAAVVAGFVVFPLAVAAITRDPARVAAILALYLLAAARYAMTGRRQAAGD